MRLACLLAVSVAIAACGGSDTTPTPTPPAPHNKTVDIFTIGDAFSPTFATAAVGDTVRWNFAGGSDGMGHNVRFTPTVSGIADITVHKTGTDFRIFNTRGTFKYVCDVHPGMNGELDVQ